MLEPIILAYSLSEAKAASLKAICDSFSCGIRFISPADYRQPIGSLVGTPGIPPVPERYRGQAFEEEMAVFAGFDGKTINLLLAAITSFGGIPLKAVVTPTNARWHSLALYEELKKERSSLQNIKK